MQTTHALRLARYFQATDRHPEKAELFAVLEAASQAAAKAAADVINNSRPAREEKFWSLRDGHLLNVTQVFDEVLQDHFADDIDLGAAS